MCFITKLLCFDKNRFEMKDRSGGESQGDLRVAFPPFALGPRANGSAEFLPVVEFDGALAIHLFSP